MAKLTCTGPLLVTNLADQPGLDPDVPALFGGAGARRVVPSQRLEARVQLGQLTAVEPAAYASRINQPGFPVHREMQRTVNFTGIPGTGTQDSMAQISMKPIANRTKEHLGVTDIGIIQARRIMMQEAIDLLEGIEPETPTAHESYSVSGVQFVEDADVTFDECVERQWPNMYETTSA